MADSEARPSKRQRTSSPRLGSDLAANSVNVDASPEAALALAPTDAEAQAQLDERWRIYELVSEEYHDIVTELPLDYHRTFMLLKELDQEQHSHTSVLRTSLTDYLTSLASSPSSSSSSSPRPRPPAPPHPHSFDRIRSDHLELVRLCEDKVNLAQTLYESVDRHIQRLDSDLARYTDQLVVGTRNGTLPTTTTTGLLVQGDYSDHHVVGGGGRSDEMDLRDEHAKEWTKVQRLVKKEQRVEQQRKKHKKNDAAAAGAPDDDDDDDDGGPERQLQADGVVIGMPIDPNEPLYCYCQRPSSGSMIGCENDDCPTAWFHYECIGIEKPPAGDWYCEECRRQLFTTTTDSTTTTIESAKQNGVTAARPRPRARPETGGGATRGSGTGSPASLAANVPASASSSSSPRLLENNRGASEGVAATTTTTGGGGSRGDGGGKPTGGAGGALAAAGARGATRTTTTSQTAAAMTKSSTNNNSSSGGNVKKSRKSDGKRRR